MEDEAVRQLGDAEQQPDQEAIATERSIHAQARGMVTSVIGNLLVTTLDRRRDATRELESAASIIGEVNQPPAQ